jgi:hypothetical protein
MKFKEYIQKHWKIIVIVLLTLFSLSKCASSCTSNQKIKKLNTEIITKDSIITSNNDSIKYLNLMLDNVQHQEQLAKESASHYAEYSSEKYKQLVNENSQLKTQVRAQKNIIKTLTDELNKCKNYTIK